LTGWNEKRCGHHLFDCGENGEKFGGYLEKLDPRIKARLDDFSVESRQQGRVMPGGQAEAEEVATCETAGR